VFRKSLSSHSRRSSAGQGRKFARLPAVQRRIQQVLAALEGAGVRYLIVGGVAIVLHGHLRTTLDLDLVVQLQEENLLKALRALALLGFEPRAPVPLEALADPSTRQMLIRDKNMIVFSLWHPEEYGFAIDLFVEEPFDFEAVYQRALVVQLPTSLATVIGLEDLIQMKRSAARPQDMADVEALLRLQQAAH
jgi:predicted nucleotidyltransferase